LGAGLVLYSKGLLEEAPAKGTPTASENAAPTLVETVKEGFVGKAPWLLYVALAGLSWGTYVPLIFYGGSELGGKPSSRLLAILCVGVAYFLIGVVFPALYLTLTPAAPPPHWRSPTGL